jgi:hypothetical protein
MSSASAISDSTPTRSEMRLVVLGQWIRAGLDLARGASAGRGLIGGAVALWQVFQAIRLAMQLAQRLSELSGVLAFAARETASAETADQGFDSPADNPSAACLRHALTALEATIRDALGLAPALSRPPDANETARTEAEPARPRVLGRQRRPRGRPPDRRPRERRQARPRRPRAPGHLKTTHPPIAAQAIGRLRLAAG